MPPKASDRKEKKEKKSSKEKRSKKEKRAPPPPPADDPTVKELKEQFEPKKKPKKKPKKAEPEPEAEAEPPPEPEPPSFSLWDDSANAAADAVEEAKVGGAAPAKADINDLFGDIMDGASLDPIEEAKKKKEAEKEAAVADKEHRARERAERRAELQAKKDAAQAEAEALRAQREAALAAALDEETAEERAEKKAAEKALFDEKVAEAAEKAAKRMLRDAAQIERKARKEQEREARRAAKAQVRREREMEKLNGLRQEKERLALEKLVQAQTDEIYRERVAELLPTPARPAAGPPRRSASVMPSERTFRCKAPALIRAGFPVNSAERGILEVGVMVIAQGVRRNDRLGVTRVKLEQGWVSCRAGDGRVLLAEMDADGNEVDDEEEEDDETEITEYETIQDQETETDYSGGDPTEWAETDGSATEFEETEFETGSEFTDAESIADSEDSTGGDSSYADAPLASQYLVVSAGKIRAGWKMESPEVGVTTEDEVIDVIEGRALDSGVLRVRFNRGWISTLAGDGTQLLLPVGGGDDDDTESETDWETATGFESQTEFETDLASETEFETEMVSETEFETDTDVSETEFVSEISTGDDETYAASSVASETEFETDTSVSETDFESESEAETDWTETTMLTETSMVDTEFSDISETSFDETVAQTEAPLPEGGPEVGTKLEIIAPAKVRRRFEGDSDDLGAAEVGDVIEVIETQLTAAGVCRVCFCDPNGDDPVDRRWMSMVAGDGTQLLRAVRGLRDWIPPTIVQEMAEEYIVVSSVKVRQDFEKDSKVIMEFEPGTARKPSKVKPLEGKQDENNVWQLKVQYGWVSTHDDDGTVMLLAVRKDVAAKKYRAVANAQIRAEFDQSSPEVGILEKSDVLEVSDSRLTHNGILRVKGRVIRGRSPLEGWVSVTAGDGTFLLSVLEEADLGAEIKAQEFRPGVHCASTYVCKSAALIRAQFGAESSQRGVLNPGEIVDVLEGRETEAGILRIKFERGWVSAASSDGTVLLTALGDDGLEEPIEESESEFGSDDDTEFTTGEDTWEEDVAQPAMKYCVIAQSRVRAGFAQDSEDYGLIEAGEVVDTLEGRVNENGIMRIRFGGGWLSTVSADGTALLTEVVDENDDDEDDLETVYTMHSEGSDGETETDSELETVTDVTDFGRDLSRSYKVKHTALVREGVSQKTRGCGTVKPGEVVDVLEGRVNELGIMRVRVSRGWLSVKSSDGTVLLEPIESDSPDEKTEEESGYSYETETQTSKKSKQDKKKPKANKGPTKPAKQYKVIVKGGAKVRSGFEVSSDDMGSIAFGETIEVLDGRLNEQGSMRVQFERGWVSTKAGDGTQLLEPVEAVAEQYRVAFSGGAKVRAGFAMASKDLGNVSFDQVLDVLDGKVTPTGVMRIKFQHGDTTGWVSTNVGDGTVLLEPMGEDQSDEDEDESEYSYETETQTETSRKSRSRRGSAASSKASRRLSASRKSAASSAAPAAGYKVLVPSKVRAGFDMASKDMGILKPDEMIAPLEERELKPGVMRIKFRKEGKMLWCSTAAGDGTPLLEKVGGDSDEDGGEESEYSYETETQTETSRKSRSRRGSAASSKEGSESEFETESAASTRKSRKSGGTGSSAAKNAGKKRYKVLAAAKVRAGFEATSADAGIGIPGEIVTSLESKKNANGILRIKFERGWVSEKAMDGTVLLASAEDWEEEEDVFGTEEEGNDWETATASESASRKSKKSERSAFESDDDETESESDYSTADEESARLSKFMQETTSHTANRKVDQYTVVFQARVRAGFEASSDDCGIAPPGEVVDVIESWKNDAGILRVKYKRGWISEFAGDGTRLLEAAGGHEEEETKSGDFVTATATTDFDDEEMDDLDDFDLDSEDESEFETESMMSTGNQVKVYNYAESDFETVGESEFETEDEEMDDVAEQYKVMHPAQIRAGFEADSSRVGEAKVGTIVDMLEARVNPAGVTRIRYRYGWLNTEASDGTVLLQPLYGDEETESGFETEEGEPPSMTRYTVLVPARVRAGFEATTEDRGIAPPGEVVDVKETRVTDAGILRVKYKRGWISEFAGDGTRLLEEADADDDESEFETEFTDETKGTAIDRFEAVGTAASRYVVIASSKVRGEFETDSAVMGSLSPGEVIETVEGRMNERGVMRVRFSRDTVPYGGWVSVRAGDGTRLLQPVDKRIAEISERIRMEDEESEWETETKMSDESESAAESVFTTGEEEWRTFTPENTDDFAETCLRYTLVGSAVVRTEFDSASEFVGTVSAGEVIECLESRVNEQGILRIKCSIGWFSEYGSDGTVKLVREGTEWYRVASEAVVRTGRDISSTRLPRNLTEGEVIEALEVYRVDSEGVEGGLLRVRFSRGWTSVQAGNGNVLLNPVSEDDRVLQEAAKKLLIEHGYGRVVPSAKQEKAPQKWKIRMEAEKKAREVVLHKIREEAEWLARVEEAKSTSVTMTEVARWLDSERLPQFKRRFGLEGIDDLKTIRGLTTERMDEIVEIVSQDMKRGHVLKLRIAVEKLRGELDPGAVRDGTVKPPKLYGVDDDTHEVDEEEEPVVCHADLLEIGVFVPHSFDMHYPIPTEDEIEALRAAEAAAEAAALEAAETTAAVAKKKTQEETAQIVVDAKAKMAQDAADADARAASAHVRVAAELAAKDEAEAIGVSALRIAEAAEGKWVSAGEERARVNASADGASAAAVAARAAADEANERRVAAQQWLTELKVALSDKEKSAGATSEQLSLEEENLRLVGIEVPRVEAISGEVGAAKKAAEDEADSLIEREREASMHGRLDDEKAVASEQKATRTAMLAAQLQEQTLMKALLAAALRGDANGVELLLTTGVDGVRPHVDIVDTEGEAAITKAALSGHKQVVTLLKKHGANIELLPVAHWSIEQVAAWFDREFKWFGKYEAQLQSAMIDGAALMEYGVPGDGERLLQTDLDISVGAHRRVLVLRIGELCQREQARSARLLAAANAERLRLAGAIKVKEQEKVRTVEAEARARLLEIETRRVEAEATAAAVRSPAARLGITKEQAAGVAVYGLSRRAMVDKQLIEETGLKAQRPVDVDLSDPVPEDLQHELNANAAAAATDAINVSIRTPGGEWHKMRVGKGVLVQELQARLVVTAGVPASAQTLLHKLRPLPEWEPLGACGVEDGAVIHLKNSAAAGGPRKLKLLLK